MKNRFQAELGSYEIFSSLAKDDLERLKRLFISRSFGTNEAVFFKGDPGYGLYLIASGKIKICATDSHGNELIFTFLTRGDLLGEIALLDGQPRSATAIAMENTDTIYLDRRDFLAFLKNSSQACIDIISMLCQRFRRLSKHLEEVSFLDVSGRIARNLTETARQGSVGESSRGQNFTCVISQETLATMVGASREMVNKILKSFVDLKLVSVGRNRITLLNIPELNKIGSYDGDSKLYPELDVTLKKKDFRPNDMRSLPS